MLLQHVSTLGGHLHVELRNLFYISVFAVLFIIFALGIPYALHLMLMVMGVCTRNMSS